MESQALLSYWGYMPVLPPKSTPMLKTEADLSSNVQDITLKPNDLYLFPCLTLQLVYFGLCFLHRNEFLMILTSKCISPYTL